MCVQTSNRVNDDDGSLEVAHALSDEAKRIQGWLEPTDDQLIEMFAEAGVPNMGRSHGRPDLFPGHPGKPKPTPPTNMQREDITRKLTTILVEILACKAEDVTDEATLKDLGADSLDEVDIVMAVEEEFAIDIDDDEAEKITTVGQIIEHIEKAI